MKNFNEIFMTDVTYDNIKSHKNYHSKCLEKRREKIVCVINYLETELFKAVETRLCCIWYNKMDSLNNFILCMKKVCIETNHRNVLPINEVQFANRESNINFCDSLL